jgi:hypothetical protein
MATHSIHLEPVYVVGEHEEFIQALSDKLEALGANGTLDLHEVSHSVTSHEGHLHWSALITATVAT